MYVPFLESYTLAGGHRLQADGKDATRKGFPRRLLSDDIRSPQ